MLTCLLPRSGGAVLDRQVGSSRAQRFVRWGLALAAFAVLVVVVRWLPFGGWLRALAESLRELGPAGVVAYGIACVGAGLLTVPAAPLSIAGGWAFGPVLGTAVTLVANTAASAIAFAIGRRLVRDRQRFARGDGTIARAVRAAGEGGFKLVLLLRLSPVTPFAALNYAFGATAMRARDFSAATLVGSLPGTAACAFAGSLLAGPGEAIEQPTPWPWIAGGGVALLVGSASFLRRFLSSAVPAAAQRAAAEIAEITADPAAADEA